MALNITHDHTPVKVAAPIWPKLMTDTSGNMYIVSSDSRGHITAYSLTGSWFNSDYGSIGNLVTYAGSITISNKE